jgi:hypothetical protein
MILPDLPLEVIIIVAQFLAADHAFATLVALHSASHAMKEETPAILYETLFLDCTDKIPRFYKEGFRPGASDDLKSKFRYIKSVSSHPSSKRH